MEKFPSEEQPKNNRTEKAPEKLIVEFPPGELPRIEYRGTDERIRNIIMRALKDNRFGSLGYETHVKAGAFLQSQTDDYLMVEFWKKDYQPFVDYLNEEIAKEE